MSNRSKGLAYVREVKRILESRGHMVEGPGYISLWTPRGIRAVHRDYFGTFDLLSFTNTEGIHGHQVCSLANKARNVKKIQALGLPAYLWVRKKNKKYDLYWVTEDKVILEEEG